MKRNSEEPYKAKDFYRQKEQEQEVILGKKAGWLLQSHFPLGDAWAHQADDLSGADQGIPDSLV